MLSATKTQALFAVLTHLLRSVPLLCVFVLACGSHGLYERMRTAQGLHIMHR